MKPILYIGLAASLALGACSSTYKTAQTPDDVYYSPRQQPQTYAASNGSNGNSVQDEDASYVQGADEEEGNYVTYQDDDQGDYERRINRFGSNGSNYSGDYWDGYNAASNLYLSSGFGYGLGYGGFGLGYSPFSSFYGPSFGLGFGIGGYYSPWSPYYGGWGYPYIGSYWPSYYYLYYGGGYYGGGYYGHGYYGYHSRPANAYGPVRASGERVARPAYSRGGTTGSGYTRPTRSGTIQPANGRNGGFVRPSSTSERPRRIFQQSSSERPVVRPSSSRPANNNNTYTRPQRVEYSRPTPAPAPSYTPSRSSGGSSGGGGGYSRPTRGGR